MATVIISILLIATIVGIFLLGATLIRKIKGTSTSSGGASTPPSSSSSSATPTPSAPATAVTRSSSNISIPAWIIPVGIAYLVIRGMFIVGSNYIGKLDWVVLISLAIVAIISFFTGKNRFLALILVSAIGCIIWFNQYHIASFTPQPVSTEQSKSPVKQDTPVEEEIVSTEPILPLTNNSTRLMKTGTYKVVKGKNRLCLSRLGDGSGFYGQLLRIDGKEYKAGESGECHSIDIAKDNIVIEFVYPPQTEVDTYLLTRKEKGGQGVYPFLEPIK